MRTKHPWGHQTCNKLYIRPKSVQNWLKYPYKCTKLKWNFPQCPWLWLGNIPKSKSRRVFISWAFQRHLSVSSYEKFLGFQATAGARTKIGLTLMWIICHYKKIYGILFFGLDFKPSLLFHKSYVVYQHAYGAANITSRDNQNNLSVTINNVDDEYDNNHWQDEEI